MNPHTSQAIGVDPTQIMQLTIRPASRFDTEGILNCLSSAFQPYRNRYTPAAFMDTILDADLLVARMQVMRVLVAVVDSKIVGTVAGGVSTPGEGHLRGMAVLPAYKGAGVAGRLLTAIEEWLAAQGCERITLDTTFPLDAAMKFYEKRGYSKSGRVSDFFGMPLIEYVKNLRDT
jgi:GNAT superfamily N-acetyltransferase